MNLLSAENLAKSFSDKWLFRNLFIGISQGEKIALVGRNGSGKSTLMSILTGTLPPDEGNIGLRKGISVGFLNQNPVFDDELTVLETAFAGDNPVLKAIRDYEHSLTAGNDDLLEKAIEQMEQLKAWEYENQITQILGQLGVTDLEKKMGQLSGGQRKRVALAKLLIEAPDLLLLDEPTNHLDLSSIEWLENYLSNQNTTLLLVTHDRYFLDKVCNRIVALENGKIYRYEGNYGYYLEKKAEREANEASVLAKNQNLYRRELEWIRRQPKARGTKAQYRVDAFDDLKEKVNRKKEDGNLELNLKMKRQGSKILELEHLSKAFGEQMIVKDFSYTFKNQDRIGIVGRNGVGKSTFLNMLTQQIAPDSGRAEPGDTTTFGYYTQTGLDFREDQRVIDVVKDIAEVITLGSGETISASQFLTQFQFAPAMQYTPVEKLSGGEKRRLQLLKILIKNPNFLILDEPTNDLDIETLNVLEAFLQNFPGCLLLVSHDRYFMDRLVENLFVFEGDGKIRNFNGNYTDYREWQDEQKNTKSLPPVAVPKKEAAPVQNGSKRKLSFKEQQEYENLEMEIAAMEFRRDELTGKINTGGGHEELTAWAKEVQKLESEIALKSDRWLELAEWI
jgi:ABC transport system ATP-binding/permease protein